jgi:hypothetical protein
MDGFSAVLANMDKHIHKLRAICQRWGGHLYLVTTEAYEKRFKDYDADDASLFSEAPFAHWHDINWSTKSIYATIDQVHPGSLIHEMGHVFADLQDPARPKMCDEYAWLGWEACLARWVGCYQIWSQQNANYGIDSGRSKKFRVNQNQLREVD